MAARRSSKSNLFEYCQKRKIGPPLFENWAAPNGYQAKVLIDGYPYPTSAVCSKKKDAEHDAAKACLASLGIFEDDTGGPNEFNNQGYPGDQGYLGGQDYPDGQGNPGANRNGRSSFGTPSGPSPRSSFSTPSPRPFDRPPRSGGSSGGGVKMPKSVLHEFCQSQKMSLPQYETEASYDGSALLGFHCVLVVTDEYFTTDRLYTNKREAEHAVARKALNVFGYYARSPLYTGDTPPIHQAAGTPSFKTPETSYKNLLQEHLQQRSIETPDYETQLTDGGYFSKVIIEGKVFKAKECCQTKKLAEQSAAKAGLVGMGVKDPESVATKLLRKNSRGRFRSTEDIPYKKDLRDLEPEQVDTDQVQGNTSWVHSRKQSEFDVDDYDDIDGEFTDFQKAAPVKLKRKLDESVGGDDDFFGTPEQRPHKMQRVGEGSDSRPSVEKRPRRRGEFEVEQVHLGNLTVGECWPEKRNIVIVGSEETSIPLFCQADMERCALEDTSTGALVDIVPGHRLIGLEGYYVVRGGQIVLRARQCQQVVMPGEPDKVLISCGVVVLHCIPRRDGTETSCDVNVLLKRYLCSQAFINVVRGLAQYFRCKQSNRPFILNKELLTAHIQDWMLEEVMAISSFSETALENVFQHTMKFDKRWARYLRDEELSKELREIQAAANQELFRRANSSEDQNQDRFRPWRLPKGNFYHRVLTTGVFIESPPEAAMRELKEETGIKLKLSDVNSSPYVDVSQTDNLNPHKGDFARYYLCGIITEAESLEEEIEEEQAEEETPTENPESSSTATNVAPLSTDPTPANTDLTYAATGSTPAITNSTFNAAYSANAAASTGATHGGTYSAYGSAGSTNTGTNSAYGTGSGYANADASSAFGSTRTAATSTPYASTNTPYASTNTTGTGSTYAGTNAAHVGAYPIQQATNSTLAGTVSTNTAAYSAHTGTASAYPGTTTNTGTGSAYGSTGSTHGSTYSAYADAYSAYGGKQSTLANTNPGYGTTGSTYTGMGSTSASIGAANTGTGSANTIPYSAYTATGSNTGMGSTNTGAFSANTGTGSNTTTASAYTAPYSAYTGSNTGINSANTGAYSANTGASTAYTATGSNTATGSANTGAYSASTGSYSAYASTGSNTGTGSANAAAYSANTASGSTYTATGSNTATGSANAGAYSASTGAYSAYAGTGSNAGAGLKPATGTNTATGPASIGAYSAYADAYSAYTSTVASNTATNSSQTGTLSTTASQRPTQTATNSGSVGTSSTGMNATNTTTGSSYHGAYSAYTHPVYAGTNASTGSTNTATGSTSASTDKAAASTDPLPHGTDKAAARSDKTSAMDQTSSTQKGTPDKSETKDSNVENEKEEESTVIRSPIVAGAVHEECKWFDMDEAKEISTVFLDIHNSHEFQKLLAKLKGIVSAM